MLFSWFHSKLIVICWTDAANRRSIFAETMSVFHRRLRVKSPEVANELMKYSKPNFTIETANDVFTVLGGQGGRDAVTNYRIAPGGGSVNKCFMCESVTRF